MTLPNSAVANYTYDAASQLTSLMHQVGGSPVASSSYTYNQVGNRKTLTDLAAVTRNFDYDALNRLTNATNSAESFTYDPVGNRTSSHLATGQIHDVANRLLEDSNFTYTYDANGNLETKTDKATLQVTAYTYDAENQLIAVTAPGLTATYRYDALGRRWEKDVNGTITRYVYDNEDILLEMDGNNQVIARYSHGLGIDEPLIMARGGQTFFYHADGLGSITEMTDSTGTVARSYTYDGFGQIVAETGTETNPYTYTAREFDPETGLLYYRTRHYNPMIGRFLQEDPIGFEGGQVNLFNYVLNNPVRWVDPEGLVYVVPKDPRNVGPPSNRRDFTMGFVDPGWPYQPAFSPWEESPYVPQRPSLFRYIPPPDPGQLKLPSVPSFPDDFLDDVPDEILDLIEPFACPPIL